MSADDPFDHPLVAFFLSDDPAEIREAARALPEASFGRVFKPEGLNDRTRRPERDGIYCAKIFGPIDDYRCNCGKIVGADHARETCDKCGVLCTESKIRNERWAHVDLQAPLLHPRLVATIAAKLGCGVANAEAVFLRRANLNDDGSVVRARRTQHGQYEFTDPAEGAREARGPGFVQQRLGVDADLLITKAPVLPAGWRPLTGAENDAYLRVINRANRLARLRELNAPPIVEHNEELLLQQKFTRLCKTLRAELAAAIEKRKRPPVGARAAELLAAVYANPADDDRRAVYADHLLELGEPRGEFIALQLANAKASRMMSKESALLRRHFKTWLQPLDTVLDPTVRFRRGFPTRATTVKGSDEAIAALLDHEAWATIEHLDTANVELLTHPCLRSLRRISVDFKTLRNLCDKATVMPGIQALALRLASSRPRDHVAVTSSRIFPNLSEIMLVCKSAHGVKDFGWLQGTPFVDGLETLVLVIDLYREHVTPFVLLLEMFSRPPKLQRATLSLGNKQVVYEISRTGEQGSGLAVDLTVNNTAVERILMGTESAKILGYVADVLELGSAQIISLTVRIPTGTWGTEQFAAFRERLLRAFPELTWLDAKPTPDSYDEEPEP